MPLPLFCEATLMRILYYILFPIFLIGCSRNDKESKQSTETSATENSEWNVTSDEIARKARVQFLIDKLAKESEENRQNIFIELRDVFIRKRDIPELSREIDRNNNAEVTSQLRDLLNFIKGTRWRLPDGGWTTEGYMGGFEANDVYSKKFDELGYFGVLVPLDNMRPKPILEMNLIDHPIKTNNQDELIDLILALEPEALILTGEHWSDIAFLGILDNLQELSLYNTLATDLLPLKNMQILEKIHIVKSKVSDLTPLQDLPNLHRLELNNTNVLDLSPLKGMSNLTHLGVQDSNFSDLTPLANLPNLTYLYLQNSEVTDLSPLKELQELYLINLENTKVTDLTPLKNSRNLRSLFVQNTGVTDITPLKENPNLSIFGK
jgi:hypothetical protein